MLAAYTELKYAEKVKQFLLKKCLEQYRNGECSIDKCAEIVGITVNEMMREAVSSGIKSNETIEEYREGLKMLLK